MYNNICIKSLIKTYKYLKLKKLPMKDLYSMYSMSVSQIYALIKQYKDDPIINEPDNVVIERPNNYKSNNVKVNLEHKKYIISEVINDPQITSKNINIKLKIKYENLKITENHISKIIRSEGYTYKRVTKKKPFVDSEKYTVMKKTLKNIIGEKKNTDKLICIDEFSFKLNSTTNYGRTKKGTKCEVVDKVKNNSGNNSVLLAISNKEFFDGIIKNGAINGKDFTKFIKERIIPKMNPENRLFMDNAQIHKCETIKDILKEDPLKGKIIYNIPYCPKYNPVEYVNNSAKCELKKLNVDNIQELQKNLGKIMKKQNKNLQKYYDKSFNHLYDDTQY